MLEYWAVKWLLDHYQWVVGTILVPIALIFLKKWADSSKKPNNTRATGDLQNSSVSNSAVSRASEVNQNINAPVFNVNVGQSAPPRNTPAKTEQAVPNLVNMGPKQKYVYVGRWPREGISDPRGEEQREVAVPALVLKIENRILSDDRKIVRALNVIAKLKFRNKNEGAEHHIDYGVWLTLRATAPILVSAIHANYC